KGDLASRSLRVELTADRHDPENRQFRHPHPLEWTDANRGRILHALYTIMLGNPHVRKPLDAPGETRFKMWWRLVGSAVEYAAELVDEKAKIKFKDLFIESEDDDADSMSLADALNTLDKSWPKAKQFTANDVLKLVDSDDGRNLREFLFPDPKHNVT